MLPLVLNIGIIKLFLQSLAIFPSTNNFKITFKDLSTIQCLHPLKLSLNSTGTPSSPITFFFFTAICDTFTSSSLTEHCVMGFLNCDVLHDHNSLKNKIIAKTLQ
jgi:hypothetical protein